jgi:hypothetical protein
MERSLSKPRPDVWRLALAVAVAVMLSTVTVPGALAVIGQELAPDARSQGLGRAFTALAEGPAATWWNPAALGLQRGVHINPYSRVQLVPSLSDDIYFHSYGGTAEVGPVGVGFHLSNLDYGTHVVRDFAGNVIGEAHTYDRSYHIGVGTEMIALLRDGPSPLRVGVGGAVKIVNEQQLGSSGGGDLEQQSTTFDVDLSALASYALPLSDVEGAMRPALDLRGGLMVANVFNRDQEFETLGEDPLVRRLHLSGAVGFHLSGFGPFARAFDAALCVERVSYSGNGSETIQQMDNDTSTSVGMEVELLGLVSARTGHLDDIGDIQSIEDWAWGFGVGGDFLLTRPGRLGGRFDYAKIPQVPDLPRIEQYSVSIWLEF